ncbi:MAG: N-acetyltransferase [Firmicutes bacterium]|nr:N-acetyltransferase [Bacillota bacterium]
MIIRNENPADYNKIHALVKSAFQTAELPPSGEEDFVLRLRAGSGYVPELAFVAETAVAASRSGGANKRSSPMARSSVGRIASLEEARSGSRNDSAPLIGHIMLTKTYITTAADKVEALLLAPLCVALEYRNKGIGAALIKHALQKAKEQDYKVVFLVGNPNYYKKFGFAPISSTNITYTMDYPPEVVQVCELEPGFLSNIIGSITIE